MTTRLHKAAGFELAPGVAVQFVELLMCPIQVDEAHDEVRSLPAVVACHLLFSDSIEQSSRSDLLASVIRERGGRARLAAVLERELGVAVDEADRVFSVWLRHEADFEGDPTVRRAEWAWQTASQTSPENLGGMTGAMSEDHARRLVELSGSWSVTVLQDGAGFLIHADSDFPPARLFVSSIYTDVFMLVRLQHEVIQRFRRRAGALVNGSLELDVERAEGLARSFATFRALYPDARISSAPRARILSDAARVEFEVSDEFDQLEVVIEAVRALAADHRDAQAARRARVTNTLLALLSVVGLPASLGIGIWQSVSSEPGELWVFLGVPVVGGSALFLMTLYIMHKFVLRT